MNWKKTKCCGTCRFWDIDAARNAAGAVLYDRWADCLAVVVTPSSWPVSQDYHLLYEPREEVRRYA